MRTTLTAFAVVGLLSLVAGQASAAPILLDFTSGTYANEQGVNFDTYNQSGFKLTVMTPGNHIDPVSGGLLQFHNGIGNLVEDNDILLTYSGGAFDLVSIDISSFITGISTLQLFGSGGQFLSIASSGTGVIATPAFTNVTSVRFSLPVTVTAPSGVTFDSMLVNNAPVAEIPEPASMVLFGLGALGCAGVARRRRNLVNAA